MRPEVAKKLEALFPRPKYMLGWGLATKVNAKHPDSNTYQREVYVRHITDSVTSLESRCSEMKDYCEQKGAAFKAVEAGIVPDPLDGNLMLRIVISYVP